MAILDNPLPIIKTKEVPIPVDKVKTGALRLTDKMVCDSTMSPMGLNFCISKFNWEINLAIKTSKNDLNSQKVLFSAVNSGNTTVSYGTTPIGISLSDDSTYACLYVYGQVAGSSGTTYTLYENRIGDQNFTLNFNTTYMINVSWDGNTSHGLIAKILDENGQVLSTTSLNCIPKSQSCNYAFSCNPETWCTVANNTDIDFYKTYIKVKGDIKFGYK